MRQVWIIALCAVALGCTEVSMPESDEGQQLYLKNCSQCHGRSGKGDGEWSALMKPRPPDLTQLSQNGVFPRARVLAEIDGYHRRGFPGEVMPEFGALLEGPTVPVDVGDGVLTPTPRPLAAIVSYLEEIQAE